MIDKRIAEILSIEYEQKLLIFDTSSFRDVYDYAKLLDAKQFEVVEYNDVEAFRLCYEKEIKHSSKKWAVIVSSEIYVPYDIRNAFFNIDITLNKLFPSLHEETLRKYITDINLISFAYEELYSSCDSKSKTEKFITDVVFSKKNISEYCNAMVDSFLPLCDAKVITSAQWIEIARKKAIIEYYAARANIQVELNHIDIAFEQFVMNDYQKLSGQTNKLAPAILPKVLDFISKGKTALIVMDGMSLFDFEIISRHFIGIDYDYQCTFAIIPTTTAISRQSLLSGKYPRQLANPFSLSKEEKEFVGYAESAGYTKQQILYTRGYNADISPFTKYVAVIINDIDDMVHGQHQGRMGMYNDITLLAKSNKLQALVKKLTSDGFSVYITSDHGNTHCTGIGLLRSVGVEVETKSKRMLILKKFAEEKESLSDNALLYPGYYLDKEYKYFICKSGLSFDNKNDDVMTHGGISIDEVIVPFIKIKAVD